MALAKDIIRLTSNVLLGLGCFFVFNEGESIVPNIIGLACAALLILINKDNNQ